MMEAQEQEDEGGFDYDKLVDMVAHMIAAKHEARTIVAAVFAAIAPEDKEICPVCGTAQ